MGMTALAGAAIGSSIIGADAASSAADTQAQSQQQAAQTQLGMFNTINAQEQPFIQAGYGATSKLSDLLGIGQNTGAPGYGSLTSTFNPTQDQLNAYPGYQFAKETGAQALRNADTPGVGALSGPALKDLMAFNSGIASQNYNNYFNQFQTQQSNIFSRLFGIAGLGQNAASNVGTSGTSLGTGAAQAQSAAGASQAAGQVGTANALSGASVPLAYLLSGNNSPSALTGAIGGVNNSAGNIFSGAAYA